MFILIASNNSHKVKEIDKFLKPLGIKTLTLSDVGISESPEEIADTFQGNALLKAKEFFKLAKNKYPVLSDDSGLCIDILDGKPGIFSARYGGEDISSSQRNKKLLEEAQSVLKKKGINEPIKAHFITHLCLYEGENRYISIQESLEGEIKKPSNHLENKAFGYDPIFYPNICKEKNLAELTIEEKNLISARGKALQKLYYFLKEYQPCNSEKK